MAAVFVTGLGQSQLAFRAAPLCFFSSFCRRGKAISIERCRLPSGHLNCSLGPGDGAPADSFEVASVMRWFLISHSVTRARCVSLAKIELNTSRLMT